MCTWAFVCVPITAIIFYSATQLALACIQGIDSAEEAICIACGSLEPPDPCLAMDELKAL